MKFQAVLSWFSRNRLLLDKRGQADGRGFYRHCVIAQAAHHFIGEAAMLS
jgi:hypothetical protein